MNNKVKVLYRVDSEKVPTNFIPSILTTSGAKSSCWFSQLPVNISESLVGRYIPSLKKFIEVLVHNKRNGGFEEHAAYHDGGVLSTAKTCPGIKSVLDKSVVISCPTEIYITMNTDGSFDAIAADNTAVKVHEEHPRSQYTPLNAGDKDTDVDIFKGYTVVKITLPVDIGTAGGETLLLLPPQFHSANKLLDTVIGEIKLPPGDLVPLSVIYMVKIPTEEAYTIHIKKGESLGYLYTEGRPTLLEYEGKSSCKSIKGFLLGNYTRRNNDSDS